MTKLSNLFDHLLGRRSSEKPKKPITQSASSAESNVRAEDGFVPSSRIRSGNVLHIYK